MRGVKAHVSWQTDNVWGKLKVLFDILLPSIRGPAARGETLMMESNTIRKLAIT